MTHQLLTGPIQGELTVADGTTYNVSPHVIDVQPEHAEELADLSGRYPQ